MIMYTIIIGQRMIINVPIALSAFRDKKIIIIIIIRRERELISNRHIMISALRWAAM